MKTILLAVTVIFGLTRSASAFALDGPIGNGGDSWQSAVIGYGPPSDSVAPKNLGEEYRRNTPVLYYTFDANFLEYFGAQGMTAVNGAMAIMNNLTNVSSYSSTLSEFPLESRHVNYQAQALGLYDLKSFTLSMLMEQMGLARSVQYAWTLHSRYLLPGTSCPAGMEYLVVQRNFDTGGSLIAGSQTISSLYSPYINNVLYSYEILEDCTGPNPLALSVPFPVDPLADAYSAVSAQEISYGNYYTGLTRDDVMGLRYLYNKKNINTESAAAGSLTYIATTNTLNTTQFPANPNVPGGFGTYDLGTLLNTAKYTDPATMQVLFPNVIATLISSKPTVVTNITLSGYYTNLITAAAGSPPQLVVLTNSQLVVITVYNYSFQNIVTNHYYANTTNFIQSITVGPLNGAAAPAPLQTNTTYSKIVFTNVPSGDYYVLPNVGCGLDIVSVLLTNNVVTTNLYVQITSGTTNSANTVTNILNSFTQYLISTNKSYDFEIAPVNCVQTPAATALYAGIENIKFVQADYDAYLSQNFRPITNNYSMTQVNSNGQASVQNFQRIVTAPDFLFTAADLGAPLPVGTITYSETNPNFNTDNVLPGLAGPGTIDPTTVTISFQKVGPVYFNDFENLTGNDFWNVQPGNTLNATNDLFYSDYFVWASFDGTTNAPVVYPNGSSLDLSGLILVQVTPSIVPNGTNGVAYNPPVTFSSTGGAFSPPYTWTTSGLPAGLSLSSNSDSTATLSGTPTQSGTYVFTLIMTDSNSRSVQWNYPIIIQ